jgi:hypothetical protein
VHRPGRQLQSVFSGRLAEFDRDREHELWRDVGIVSRSLQRGLCFRVDLEDLESPEETWQQIVERSSDVDVAPNEVDILVDLRSVRGESRGELKELVIDFVLEARQFLPRSVVVAGSSALPTVAAVPEKGLMSVPRMELKLWADVVADTQFRMPCIFGDYGVVFPGFDRGNPVTNMNAKIRYTAFENIHYFSGQLYAKSAPAEQYHSLAQHVMASGFYEGYDASFGDRYIYDCARAVRSPRSAAPWVAADQNRHIEHTAGHIAGIAGRLPGADSAELSLLVQGKSAALDA